MCIPFLILKVRCSGELLCVRVLVSLGGDYWASESEPYTSAFDVKFCLYNMVVRWYAHLSWLVQLAKPVSPIGHCYCQHVPPFHLLH